MYDYKIALVVYWKDASTTHEVIDASFLKPFEDYLELYGQSILINYEESLSNELLEKLDHVVISDVTFLGIA
jgi:hypothetical protein